MAGEEIDSILSGVIIVLLIVIVWKWMNARSSCGGSSMTLSCGCKNGVCKCRGASRMSVRKQRCPGGRFCVCGCPPNGCRCGPQCLCQKQASKDQDKAFQKPAQQQVKESMQDYCGPRCDLPEVGTPGYEPKIVQDDGNYSGDTVQKMALEPSVITSQQDYINGLGFPGLPTGSSHETTLEETGRDAFTASWYGLTQRKFCKARALAQPAPNARQMPSDVIKEWCDIDMESLI